MLQENAIKSKKILKNTLFLYFRMLLLMFISFYTSRVILHNLGVVDFGIYNVVGGLTSMFAFFRSSLSNVTQRYLNIELGKNDIEKAKQIFNLHQTIYIILAVVLVLLLETIGLWFFYNKLVIPIERISAAFWVFQFTVLSLILTILSVVYDSAIIAHEDMKVYSYVGIFEGGAKLFIAYLISISFYDKLISYAFLLFLLSFMLRIYYSYYCNKHYKECKFAVRWNPREVKKAFTLVGWNTIGTLVWSINDQGINILLNMFYGPIVNAARGISSQVSNTINNFSMNFFTSVRPQIVKSYAAKDFEYLYKLFYASSKFSIYLLWFLCLPIMLCIDVVLNIWLYEVPEYTHDFVIWILAYTLVNALDNPIWSLALAIGKLKKYILIGSTISFLAFPLSYICLYIGCLPQSVYICLLGIRIIYIGVVLNIVRSYIPISLSQYLSDVIIPVIGVLLISGSICIYINSLFESNFVNSIIICIISWFCIFISIYICGIQSNERKMIKSFLIKKIRR